MLIAGIAGFCCINVGASNTSRQKITFKEDSLPGSVWGRSSFWSAAARPKHLQSCWVEALLEGVLRRGVLMGGLEERRGWLLDGWVGSDRLGWDQTFT